jgi:hypothetical protein
MWHKPSRQPSNQPRVVRRRPATEDQIRYALSLGIRRRDIIGMSCEDLYFRIRIEIRKLNRLRKKEKRKNKKGSCSL